MACSDQVSTQDLENAKKYVQDMYTFEYSNELSFVDYDGVTRTTAKGLESKYTMTAINGGVWESGQEFTAYNQYMIYSGTPYRPTSTTTLPYTVGASPDLSGVYPFALDKDHNEIDGREVYGAHDVSSISNGDTTLSESLALLSSDVSSLQELNRLNNIEQESLTASQQGEKLSKGDALIIDCMGDSTMFGFTALSGVQSPYNAPASLGSAISLLFTGLTDVNNRAISGTTLRGMLDGTDGSGSTFDFKLNGGVLTNSDVIYCNHGINDSQLDLSINQYRLDVIEFVYLCRKYGKTPILVTPNPNIPFDIIDDTKSKRLDLYVQIMREVAKSTNTDLVDQNYFIKQSTNLLKMQDMVPDGAHLNDDGYRQAGYNLLIPLISARTLKKQGENVGLSSSTYFDNLSTDRNLQKQNSRCGISLTGQTLGGIQGVSYPFILDSAQSEIMVSTLQYNDAVAVNASVNGVPILGRVYNNKTLGDTSLADWDAAFSLKTDFRAGLQILGLLTDIVPVDGNYFIFSGVSLRSSHEFIRNKREVTSSDNESIISGDTVLLDYYFENGTVLEFADKAGSSVFTVSNELGIFKLKTWANGTELTSVDLSSSTIPNGTYPVEVRLYNGQIQVYVSNISATITASSIPNTYIKNPNASYYRL